MQGWQGELDDLQFNTSVNYLGPGLFAAPKI